MKYLAIVDDDLYPISERGARMKIIIDIPEEDYQVIQDTVFKYDLDMLSKQSEKDYRNTIILLNLIDHVKEGTVIG